MLWACLFCFWFWQGSVYSNSDAAACKRLQILAKDCFCWVNSWPSDGDRATSRASRPLCADQRALRQDGPMKHRQGHWATGPEGVDPSLLSPILYFHNAGLCININRPRSQLSQRLFAGNQLGMLGGSEAKLAQGTLSDSMIWKVTSHRMYHAGTWAPSRRDRIV